MSRFLAQDSLDGFLDSRDTGRTADEQDLVDIIDSHLGIGQGLVHAGDGAVDEVARHFIEFRTGQIHIQMLRAFRTCRDVRQVDVGAHHAGEFDLGLFSGFTDSLHGHLVLRQVDAMALLEFIGHPVHDALIEVIAAQMSIAVRRLYFEYAVTQFQDGHIEGAAAEVIDQDGLVIGLVDAVSQCSSGRFIDDTLYIQTGDTACILRGLTLGIVEVGRDRDDGFRHFFTQIPFCITLHLFEDHGGNLFRRIALAIDRHSVLGTHMTFDGADRSFRVGNSLTFSQLANQSFPVFRKTNYGRRQTAAFLRRDNGGLAAFHYSNNRVRST